MNATQNKFPVPLICLALVIVTFAAFSRVRYCDFVNYDDNKYVTENPRVRTGLTLGNITWAFTSPHFFMWHPVTSLSHMLDCELFGLKPGWHHVVSLLFHIANSLLLFTIFRRMTGTIWQSAFVAAVFALHPLNVESVAWVAERKNILSGFFWMLTIASYIRYAKNPRISSYLMVAAVFALALMSKPTIVALPFVLLLLDYWPLYRFRWTRHESQPDKIDYKTFSTWHLIEEKIPLLLMSAIVCVITIIAQQSGGTLKSGEHFPFGVRLTNALTSYVIYIGKMIYPAHLAVFYPHPGYSLPLWQPIVSFLLLAAVSVGAIYLGRRRPYLPVGWFWFLGTLIPVIGLVQSGAQRMADRYAYVTLIGLFIIIAWGANDLLTGWKHREIVLSLSSLAIILILSVCTWFQTRCWLNDTALFEHALAVTKNNYVAYHSLGNGLFREGKIEEAIACDYESLRIDPEYLPAHASLGVAFGRQGKLDQAIEEFRHVLKADPKFDEVYYNLGVALAAQGKSEEAFQQFRKAVELNPSYVAAYNNMGALLLFQGKFDEAVACYQKALKLAPDFPDLHNNLGTALSQQGKLDEAIAQFNQALQLNPNAANAHTNLGFALIRQGSFEQAVAHLSRAIELNPDFCEAHYYLAIVLVQKGQTDEGIKHAEIALRLAQSAGNKQLAEQIWKYIDSCKASPSAPK